MTTTDIPWHDQILCYDVWKGTKMMGTSLSPMSGIHGLIVCLTVLVTLHCVKTPTRIPKRGVGLFKLVISKRTAYHVGKTQQRS